MHRDYAKLGFAPLYGLHNHKS